ncbi:hypothetical protein MVEN_01214400 [Mycena venus]|uniref:HMG box domain-containing protein n=1 Tax=Mycena venus TaxID=2733690 RepID=A0A8H7CW37_9AGAR|nr:hypothetical protein MVEN_01214400 [Mycena venus]
MPATIVRRTLSSDATMAPHSDVSMKDAAMAFLNFDDHQSPFDEQQFLTSPEEPMLFDFDNDYPPGVTSGYDFSGQITDDMDIKPIFTLPPEATAPIYELGPGAYSPDSFHGSDRLYHEDLKSNPYPINNWFNNHETDTSPIPSPSSPIPIPSGPQSPLLLRIQQRTLPPSRRTVLSPHPSPPSALAAALPLPGSSHSHSPSSPSSFEDPRHLYSNALPQQTHIESLSVSPHETQTPAWAAQLWDGTAGSSSSPGSGSGSRHLRTPSSPRSSARHSPLSTHHSSRLPMPARERRNSLSSGLGLGMAQLFPSSSAPSVPNPNLTQNTIRAYSRRAEPRGAAPPLAGDDTGSEVGAGDSRAAAESPPLKSVLRPPKLAPSAWQLYFTDWIQRQQANSSRKLNVAQAAKEAGQEYASLTEEEKEPYKRRSQAAKDIRERQLAEYMRTLTPDDIKRENAFRSAQRKAGKSRKSNIKDPNAPKKPLSAYFMFLQRIRASPELVREVFGEETETTKQSVLAAARWRGMTDEERKPFLAQAEQEKMEYEAARRVYEDGASGGTSSGYPSTNSFNFSILPGSPAFPAIKVESESESDDGHFFLNKQ